MLRDIAQISENECFWELQTGENSQSKLPNPLLLSGPHGSVKAPCPAPQKWRTLRRLKHSRQRHHTVNSKKQRAMLGSDDETVAQRATHSVFQIVCSSELRIISNRREPQNGRKHGALAPSSPPPRRESLLERVGGLECEEHHLETPSGIPWMS